MLKQTIQKNLEEAVKNKDEIVRSVLRMLLAAILNKEKDKKYKENIEGEAELTDQEIIEIASSEIKKRKEAIALYEKGDRQELAEKEKKEVAILRKYLPEQLSEEEIRKLAREAIEKISAKDLKDIGKVMAELMPEIKGKADGALVSKVVKELLS